MLKNKLLKNGLLYTLSGLLLQGVNFFTLPLFTRMLSVESFGIVSIYNTWLSILSIFISFQSHGSIGNAKINYSKEEFDEYVSNVIVFSSGVFICWIVLFVFFKNKISQLLNLSIEIILIMLIQSFFNTIIILKTTIYIFEQKAKEKIILSFVNLLFNIILSVFLIKYFYSSETYLGRIIGGGVPVVFLGIYFYISIIKKKRPTFNMKHWKFCLSLTIPIIFHSLSGVILGSSDRVMLEKFKGFYETGVYSFIYNFGIIISMLWGTLNNAWVPWYYENMNKSKSDLIKKYSKIYLELFTTICAIFLMISPEIIKIMAPEKFMKGLKILPLIVLGCYFNFLYTFPSNYEFYIKKTKYIALATTGAALVNFLLNLYLIPIYGVLGAALTTLIAYICMFLFHEGITRKKFKYSILSKIEYLKKVITIGVFSMIYWIFLENIFIRFICILIYLIIIGIKFYKNSTQNE